MAESHPLDPQVWRCRHRATIGGADSVVRNTAETPRKVAQMSDALQIPADLLPADGRFGAGPSKIQTGHLDALAATGSSPSVISGRIRSCRTQAEACPFVSETAPTGLLELLVRILADRLGRCVQPIRRVGATRSEYPHWNE